MLRLLISVAFVAVFAFAAGEPDELLKQAHALRLQRQWKEAAFLLATQDLTVWSEAKQFEALQLRGQCESFAKMGAEAEATFRQAIALQPKNADVWVALGDNYLLNLPEKSDEAAAAYREVLKLTGNSLAWQRFSAVVSLARVLTDEARPGEALAVLDPLENVNSVPPNWRVKLIRARGHALAAAGRDAEALSQFRAALAMENLTTPPVTK